MNWSSFPAIVGMIIPAASLMAVMAAVFMFVYRKGSMDALKDVADTYKKLAEGYKETIDQLESKLEQMSAQIENLERTIETQKTALGVAIDELIDGFERAGFERKQK